jgi:hypothetical protein
MKARGFFHAPFFFFEPRITRMARISEEAAFPIFIRAIRVIRGSLLSVSALALRRDPRFRQLSQESGGT